MFPSSVAGAVQVVATVDLGLALLCVHVDCKLNEVENQCKTADYNTKLIGPNIIRCFPLRHRCQPKQKEKQKAL